MELTQARVRELFDYREDGFLIRKTTHLAGKVAGGLAKNGYFTVSVNNRRQYVHRVIFLWHHGWLPAEVDHHDLNCINNRIGNLRPATSQQNKANQRLSTRNKSGFKGVSWSAGAKKWWAYIREDGKTRHLGLFERPEEAAEAYAAAAKRVHGEFAHVPHHRNASSVDR